MDYLIWILSPSIEQSHEISSHIPGQCEHFLLPSALQDQLNISQKRPDLIIIDESLLLTSNLPPPGVQVLVLIHPPPHLLDLPPNYKGLNYPCSPEMLLDSIDQCMLPNMPSPDISDFEIQEKFNSMLGRLIPSLVHEINNPLQAIQGALSLAKEDSSDHEQTVIFIDLALRETERLTTLLKQLRNLYRSDTSKPQVIQIYKVLHDIFAVVGKELSRLNIYSELILPDQTVHVRTITGILIPALLKLILSSADFTHSIQGKILKFNCVPFQDQVRIIVTIPEAAVTIAGIEPVSYQTNLNQLMDDLIFCRRLLVRTSSALEINLSGEDIILIVDLPIEN